MSASGMVPGGAFISRGLSRGEEEKREHRSNSLGLGIKAPERKGTGRDPTLAANRGVCLARRGGVSSSDDWSGLKGLRRENG